MVSFPFITYQESRLWVNTNGHITFSGPYSSYQPNCRALDENLRMVAPYWSDIDMRRGGDAYYRQTTTDKAMLQKATADVLLRYPNMVGINLKWLLIATWEEVAPYAGDFSKRLTFQVVLTTDGIYSFAIFYYNKIEWADGWPGGNAGPAKAGFDLGDGVNLLLIDDSCTEDIVNVVHRSNVNQPGKFVFRIDNVNITTGVCEEGVYEDGKQMLNIFPTFVSTMGHTPVALTGPCFPEAANVTCTFNDDIAKGPISVAGVIQTSLYGPPTAVCIAPYLYVLGRISVNVSVSEQSNNYTANYNAFLTVSALAPSIDLTIIGPEEDVNGSLGIAGTDKVVLDFAWDPSLSLLGNSSFISIGMVWFNPETHAYEDLMIVADNLTNSGRARILFNGKEHAKRLPKYLKRSFVNFNIWVNDGIDAIRSSIKIWGVNTFAPAVFLFLRDSSECSFLGNPVARDLMPCPCLTEQAQVDNNFRLTTDPDLFPIFHPGGKTEYRQRLPNPNHSRQQCVYGYDGRIIVGPPGGGTADKVSPEYSTALHFLYDVGTWYPCCDPKHGGSAKLCEKYYYYRYSDDCSKYEPPPPARGNGDPHLMTFDKLAYTFNGAGEFYLVKGSASGEDIVVQVRMEELANTNATIFTALAARQGGTVVQVQRSTSGTGAVDILVNGYSVHFDVKEDPALMTQTFDQAVSISALSADLTSIAVSLSSGLSFTISTAPEQGAMSIIASATKALSGKLSGLLGNFDGDMLNDLCTPTGQIIPTTSSLQDIHFLFGITWMVQGSTDTIFVYPPGKQYSDYAFPNFQPKMDMPDIATMPPEAIDLCGGSIECLFDYEATGGDVAFVNNTIATQEAFEKVIEVVETIVLLCPSVDQVTNGAYTFSNGNFPGSVVTFTCNDNFTMDGVPSIVCTSGDSPSWNGTAPKCIANQVVPPAPDNNGNTDSSTSGLSFWEIFGIVVGVVAGVALITCIATLIILNAKRNSAADTSLEMQ